MSDALASYPCCSMEDVAMRTYDFAPLWRSSVGFDRLFDLINDTQRLDAQDNYPPYDIVRTGCPSGPGAGGHLHCFSMTGVQLSGSCPHLLYRLHLFGSAIGRFTISRTSCCSPYWPCWPGPTRTVQFTASSMSISSGCATFSCCLGGARRPTARSASFSSNWIQQLA